MQIGKSFSGQQATDIPDAVKSNGTGGSAGSTLANLTGFPKTKRSLATKLGKSHLVAVGTFSASSGGVETAFGRFLEIFPTK